MFSIAIDNLSDTSDTKKKVNEFWVESHRLFRGLLVFKKYGIVHHDLKPQNLVYNIKTGRINFIDFGHMRNFKYELDNHLEHLYKAVRITVG